MSYWLDANELLAVATIAKVPVVLLEKHEDGFYFSSSNLNSLPQGGHLQPIFVSIRASRTERVESHFERVVSEKDLKSIDASRLHHAQRQQIERTSMEVEDALSQQFAQQLALERSCMREEEERSRQVECKHDKRLAGAEPRSSEVEGGQKQKPEHSDFEDNLLEEFEHAMRQDRDAERSGMLPEYNDARKGGKTAADEGDSASGANDIAAGCRIGGLRARPTSVSNIPPMT